MWGKISRTWWVFGSVDFLVFEVRNYHIQDGMHSAAEESGKRLSVINAASVLHVV